MPPHADGKCCQSTPRCKSCPVWRTADVNALRELVGACSSEPEHLAGIPSCLHKYEPALLRAWREQDAAQQRAA